MDGNIGVTTVNDANDSFVDAFSQEVEQYSWMPPVKDIDDFQWIEQYAWQNSRVNR